MSWPNKEQLAYYLNVEYQGEYGAYGDDLLESFDQLDDYEIQQHILALWEIMPRLLTSQTGFRFHKKNVSVSFMPVFSSGK